METNVPVYINNLKEMQELEEEQLKELGSANAPTVYFTTAIQKSEEPALAPDNVAISTSSGSSSFQKNPVAQKHFQNVKNLLSNYISTQTTTAPKALVQNPIDKVFAGKLIVFSLKVTSNQANGTNDVAASYQKEADDLSQNEKTKELLEQIILENYAKDHGKNVDDLTDAEKKDAINQFNNMTDEEKIDLINQYVEDHVDYEWEENNELSDMDALVSQLLGGGNVEGDCEEIAILKAALLEAAGIDAELGFTSSDGKTIDHVVVIVGETILNTTGADSVTLDDILIKTSHDKNGNVTVTSKGTYELNTHEGSDEPTIGSTDVANIFGEYGTTVKNPDGTTVLIYGNSETSSKANAAQYVEDYKKAAAEAKETGKPVVIEVTGSLGAKNGVVVLPDGSTKFFGASGYNSGLDRAKWFAHNWNYENGNHDYLSDLKTEGVGEAESPGKAVEILQKAGTEKTESFDPLDCFFFTESGFMQLDPDRIYDYMRTIMIIANLMRIFAMLNSWEAETRGLIHEEDTGQKSDYESFGEEVVNRWVQGTMTAVNLQVQQLIQNVSSYNSEHFKELTGEIKDAHDDFEDALYDVISSGGNQREYWKEMGQVSGEYLDAVEGMADSMNAMSQAQSNASKAAKRKDGDMDALLNTATKELASQLKDIVKRSDEGKSKVSGLDIFMGVLCGLLGLGALFASFFVPGLLVLAVPLLTQFGLGIKDAVDKSNNDDCYLKPDMTKIDRLRDSFVRLQIVQRELIMFHGWDSDTRNLVHQEMTGIGGRRSRKETVSKIYEEKLNFDSLMFETTLNLNMQTIQVHNMKRYCELQYDKVASFGYRLIATLSAGFRLAGMVLALVAAALAIAAKFIPGPIGAILEGISALCSFASMVSTFCADALQYAAVEYADSAVDDAIHYEKSKFQPKDDDPIFAEPENDIITYYFGDGSEMGDAPGIDTGEKHLIKTTSDDMKVLDTVVLGEAVLQINSIQNMKRLYAMCMKEKASMRKLVHMEMTGIGSMESSPLTISALEADLSKIQELFAMRVTLKSMELEGENREIAQRKAVENARTRFLLGNLAGGGIGGSAGAALGSIGGGTGALAGMALGYAIGSLIGMLIADQMIFGWADNAKILESSETIQAAIERAKKNGNSTEAKLRILELKILQEMLNCPLASTGGGSKSIDFKRMGALKSSLGEIYNIFNSLAHTSKIQTQMRSLVHQEMTGINSRTSSEIVSVVIRSDFEATMKAAQFIEQFREAQVQYENRINDAKKSLRPWKGKFWTSIGLLAAKLVLWAIQLIFKVPTDVIPASFIAAAMNFNNSIWDLAYADKDAKEGYGNLKEVKVSDIVSKVREYEEKDDEERKDINPEARAEVALYKKLDTGLIEDGSDGNQMLNAGYKIYYQELMEGIYRVKDLIAKLQAAKAEHRSIVHSALTGIGSATPLGEEANQVDQRIALELVELLFARIESIVERQNQINAAKMQLVMEAVGFSLGLVSFIISSITLGAGISDTYAKDNIASNNNKMYSADKLVPLPEAETDALQTEIDDLIKLQESLGKTTKITSIISPIVSFLKVIAPIVTEASYKSHKNSESSGKKAVNEKDIKHSSTGNQMADKLNASQDQSIRHSIQSGRNPVQAMDKTWEKWINIILFQAITSLANMIHLSIVLPLIEPEVTRAEMTNSQSQVKDALQRIHTVTDKFKEGQALTPQWARYVQHQIAQASKYVATLQKSGDPQVKAQGATIEEALKDYGQIVAIIHDNVGEISGAKVEFLKGALEEVDAKLDGLPILKDSKELQLATLASKATLEDVAKGAAQSKELEEKLLQLQKLMADGKTEEAAALCKEITPLLQENSAFLAALISNKDVPEAEKKEAQAFKDQLDALTTQFNEADPKSMDTALIKDLAGQIHMEAGVLISTLQAKAILVVPDRSPEAVKTEMQKALQIAGNGEFTVKVGQLSPEVAHLLHQQGSYKAWVLEDGTFSTHSPMIAGPEEVLANPSFRAELSTKDIFINADSIKAAASLGDQINSQIPINPDEIIRASVAAQDVKCQIDPVSSQAVPDLDINAVVKMINQFVQSKATPASTVEATEAQQLNAIKEAIVTAIVSNVKKEMAEIAPLFATEKPQPNQPLAPNPALKTVSPETKATQVVSAKDATVKSTNPNIKAEVVVYPNILSEVNNISRSSSSTVASQIQINAQQSSTTTTVKSAEQTQVLRQITEEVSTERVVKQAFVPQFETPTQTKTIPQSSNFIQAVAAAAEIINPETVVEAAFVFPNKENERTVQTQKAVQSAANIQAREADPLTAPVIGNRKSTIRTQTVINPAAAETVNKIVSQTQDKPVQFIAEQKQQSNASQAHLARADAIEQAILGTQGNQKVNTAPVSKEGIPINKLSEKELVETLMSLRDQRDQILKSQKQTEQIKIVKEEIESLQKTLQQLTDGSIKVPEFVASKEEYEKILKQEVQSKTAELEDLEKADKGDTKSKFAAAKKISEKTKAIVSALQDKVKARLVQEGRIKPNMKEAEIRRIVEHETDRLIQKSEKESVKATAEKSVTKESAKTQGSKETPATTIVAAKEKVENKANTNPIAEVEEAKAAETDSPKDTVKISKNHSEIKSSPAQTQLHVAVKQKEVLVQKAENLKIQLETVKKQTATTIAKAEIAEDQLKPEVEKLKQEIQKLDLNIQSYQDLRTEHKPESPEFGLISRMIEDAQTQKASLTDKISQLTGEVETLKTEVRAQKETTQKIETEIIKVTAQATEANTQIATVKATLAAVQGINTASVKEATEDKTLAKEKVNTKNDKGSAKKADNSKEASPSTINMINKVSHEKPSREKPFQKLAENQTIQEPVTTDVKQEKAPQTVTMAGQTIQQPSQQSIPKAALNTAPPTEINPKNPIVTNTQQVNAQKTAINTTTPTEISPKNLTVITNTTTAITQVSVPIETAKEPEIVSAIVKEQAKTEQVQSRVNQDKVIEQVKGEIIELEKNVIAVKAQVMAPPAELSKEEYQAVLQTQIEQKEKEVEMLKAVNSGNQAAKTEVLKQSTAKTEVMISVLETKVQIRLEKEMKITGKTLPEKAKEMVEKETTRLIKEETKALQAGPLSQKEVPVSIPQNLDQILKEHTSEKPIHTIPNINIPIFKDMPLEKFIPEARQAAKGQSLLLAYIDQIEKAMQTAQTTPTTATNAPGQTTAPQNTATPAPVTEAMQADPKMLLEQLKSELVKLQIEKNTIIKEIEVLKVELKTLSKELAAKLPALEAQERAVENQMNKVGQKIIDIDKNVAKLRDLLSNQKPGTKEYELIAKMIRDYEGEKEALFGKMKDLNAELSMLKGEADQVVKEMRKIKVQIREAFQKLAQTDTKIMEVQNAIAQTVKALEEGEKELKKNRKNNEKEEDAVTAAKEKERNSGVSSAIRSLLGNGNGKNKDQKQKQTVLFKKEEEEKEPVHASGSFIGTKENDLYSQAASAARAQKTLNGKHNGTSVA